MKFCSENVFRIYIYITSLQGVLSLNVKVDNRKIKSDLLVQTRIAAC